MILLYVLVLTLVEAVVWVVPMGRAVGIFMYNAVA